MIDYQFKDFIDRLDVLGTEEFVVVHKEREVDLQGGSMRETISSVLVPNAEVKKEAKDTHWVCNAVLLRPNVMRYADAPDKYKRWGIDGRCEPLVYQQFFNNLVPERYKVVEEFILLFNLYEDKAAGQFKGVNISSDTAVVIKFSDDEISIRKDELRKFLALKKMTLFLQFDHFFFGKQTLSHYGVKQSDYKSVINSDYQYLLNYQEEMFPGQAFWRSNARLLGKKAVYGYANYKEPDIWGSGRKEREYVDFIVDVMDNGKQKKLTSNLDELAEDERKAYSYRPVFFKRDVLEKYYKNTELYSVEDGVVIKKGSWTLEIDNDHAGHVSSYLVDLSKLNFEEQCYWRSYNTIPVGNLSEVKFRRDFLVDRNVEPSASDLLLKKYFREFSPKFLKKYGYDLFLPLREGDSYFFQNIRRPLNDDINEFDQIFMYLSKSLNDSINVGELNKQFPDEKFPINMLTQFIQREFGADYDIINTLRAVQEFRSKGVAHRKGGDYQKLFKKLKVENLSRLAIIDNYLGNLAEGFRQLSKLL